MGNLRIIVDHEKIEYTGPFSAKDLFRHITAWVKEKGFDFKQEKDFEHHTNEGIQIEWQGAPWKKITDYAQYMFKIRIVGHNINKIDVVKDKKKQKVENGKIEITIDSYLLTDYDSYWDSTPILQFIRTIFDKFVHKVYTENFEQRLVHDTNTLTNSIKQLLNIYRHYSVISRPA
ncbi:hypothetical protein HYU10_04705 [Candidatus Woesearchaeota archaeon]|nr:hypothetical protein [Candidatus Woesearchaeota archaeon]MBI2661166.1 hypothetical protein [Candidatus Woesearchaeota archaeon]